MDEHTSGELAYQNGYAAGFEAGKAKWISVKDRLPEANKKVIGTKKGADTAFVFYGKWNNGNWYDLEWSCYRYGVTHWMPLPQPPKGE